MILLYIFLSRCLPTQTRTTYIQPIQSNTGKHYHFNVDLGGQFNNKEQFKSGTPYHDSLDFGRKFDINNIEKRVVEKIVNKYGLSSNKKVRDILENRIPSIHRDLKLNEVEGSDYQFIIGSLIVAGEAIIEAIGVGDVGAAIPIEGIVDTGAVAGVDAITGLGFPAASNAVDVGIDAVADLECVNLICNVPITPTP